MVGEVSFADADTFVAGAASAARTQPEWASVPAPVRGRAIAHIGRLIEDNAEALARLVTREIGKPYGEALGEVREIVDTCDFFLGEGRRLYGQTVPSEMSDKQLFTFRKPVGTVAVITAGNFPVAVPSWYIVPALLAGNTIVWKPAEYSAVVSAAFHELFVARRWPARRRLQHRPCRWPGDVRGSAEVLGAGPHRQGRLHRIVGGRARDRGADRTAPADGMPRARRQESAWSSLRPPTSISPSKARCSPASAPPDSGVRRSAP